MKRALLRLIHALSQSGFSARGDAMRAESRAEMAHMSGEGKAWNAMRKNVALLGIRTDSGSRPKMVFGTKR